MYRYPPPQKKKSLIVLAFSLKWDFWGKGGDALLKEKYLWTIKCYMKAIEKNSIQMVGTDSEDLWNILDSTLYKYQF